MVDGVADRQRDAVQEQLPLEERPIERAATEDRL
jgi:hypothetical protein